VAIAVVSAAEVQRLWDENQVEQKRRAGLLLEIVADSTAATNPRYANGRSLIVKLLTPTGQHIGTVHEIVFDDGRPSPHSHPKDYTLRDCSRVRRAEVE
jgi:hypothetical protein